MPIVFLGGMYMNEEYIFGVVDLLAEFLHYAFFREENINSQQK